MDRELWKFINTFAPWLSAIGTISAVIFSLYLARRDRNVRLKITAGHRLIVTPGTIGPHPEYLVINVVNIGHREARLINIAWKVGLLHKEYGVIVRFDSLSSPMPTQLKDGEEANYILPLDMKADWIQNFIKGFLFPFHRIRSRFIKVEVRTSIGKNFTQKIERGLRKILLDSVKTES
jgi:hypothetical protein